MVSQVPVRYPSGVTQDQLWQPLAQIGQPNPLFYHQVYDDFDVVDTNRYTVTNGSTGSVAAAASFDGGAALFTTAATANDFEVLAGKQASINLTPDATSTTTSAVAAAGATSLALTSTAGITQGQYVQSATTNSVLANTQVTGVNTITNTITISTPLGSSGVGSGATLYFGSPKNKTAFLFRIQSPTMLTTAGFKAGLMAGTLTAPFTDSNITDGIYVTKAAGATTLIFTVAANGLKTTATIPATAYQLANSTNLDIGFYVDRQGNIQLFVGQNLVGYTPQSGTGLTALGATTQRMPSQSFQSINGAVSTVASGNPAFSVLNLTPVIAVNTSAASVVTANVDFFVAARER